QKAFMLPSRRGEFIVGTRPVPTPGRGELLIRVEAAALNPIDWKIQAETEGEITTEYPVVLGLGTAGVVVEVGDGVAGFDVGDNVYVVVTPGILARNDYCSLQQYTLGVAVYTSKIPPNITFDQAASIPVGLDPPAIGFFGPHNAKLTSPIDKPGTYQGQSVVILGGSGSVGFYAIQLARLAGFSTIITTASPRHTALLKSIGATHVVDRRLPRASIVRLIHEVHEEVHREAGAPPALKLLYDAVSEPATLALGREILAPAGGGGHMLVVLPSAVPVPVPGTEETGAGACTVGFSFGSPHTPEHAEFGKVYWAKVYEWFRGGTIVPNKVEVLPGGLHGVAGGLERLRAGKVSGYKLVVRPQETV
ncbi:GroES-like protein, partial [Coniophora puteana RWD-64-598 SS2]